MRHRRGHGAARPVVATAVNSVPDIVISGETGLLVPPGRPDLLSRALAYLVEDPAVAARLGYSGRARLGDELTPAALGIVLDQTYGAEPTRERATLRGELEVVFS